MLPQPVLIIGTFDKNGKPNAMNAAWGGPDFVGIVSAKNDADKIAKTGWRYEKSENINAPVFTDFPMTLECRIKEKIDESEEGYYIVAKIVNILVDEKYLTEDGKPDVEKMQLITYDPVHHGYIALGQRVGNAFADGKRSYMDITLEIRSNRL